MNTGKNPAPLLGVNDPPAVKWYNRQFESPVLLVCEHAGRHVPERLNMLGLPQKDLDKHIGWDIGAASLAKQISDALEAPLILQRYSRLVIDCNRPPDSPESIPAVSDGIRVPGNERLDLEQTRARQRDIFLPFNEAIDSALQLCSPVAAFSIHSYTPQMNGVKRPWHAGFLARQDLHTANELMNHILEIDQNLTMALNEPYQIDDESDWFVPHYAEARALKHTLIEVRNDQLLDDSGIARWAHLISEAIQHIKKEKPQ